MEKKNNKIDNEELNKCIKIYKKLGSILITFITIAIVALVIYLLAKLNVLGIIGEFLKLLIPLFISIIIAWLLNPLIDKLDKHMPRLLACIISYVVIIGIIVFIFYLIIPSIVGQGSNLIKNIPKYIKEINKFIGNLFKDNPDAKEKVFKTINAFYNKVSDSAGTTIINSTKSIVSFIANLVFTLMISFYLSFDYHKVNKSFYKFIPDRYMDAVKSLFHKINKTLRRYFDGVLIVMLLVFITQSIGFSLAGLKSPLVFALFCALTDIIPYFGPWIGGIPAAIFGFVIDPLVGLFTCISIIVCQTLENNFYQPLIMGHSMSLHPVVIMLGLVIFGRFFGIIGMVICVPVIATIKIILEFVNEKTNFFQKIKNYKKKTA